VLPEHVYRMLHLNEWTDAGGAFPTYAEVSNIFDAAMSPRPGCSVGAYYLGLDLGLSHDATVAAVLHCAVGERSRLMRSKPGRAIPVSG